MKIKLIAEKINLFLYIGTIVCNIIFVITMPNYLALFKQELGLIILLQIAMPIVTVAAHLPENILNDRPLPRMHSALLPGMLFGYLIWGMFYYSLYIRQII